MVIGNSVIHVFLDVLNNGDDPRVLNHTHITLIPKIMKSFVSY